MLYYHDYIIVGPTSGSFRLTVGAMLPARTGLGLALSFKIAQLVAVSVWVLVPCYQHVLVLD